MWAIMKKEFKSYFLSPIGYVVTGILLIVFSIFFYLTSIQARTIDLSSLYYYVALYGLIICTPILTMRMFSEERKNGTEQLLLTSPKSITSIVLGKFTAAACIVVVAELLTLIYYFILDYFAAPSLMIALATILGFLLLSLAYISLGMFISTITENQIICCVITIAIFMGMWFLLPVDSMFSLILDFTNNFIYGLIPIATIIKFISFTILFILLSIVSLQRRKSVR